MSVPQSEIIVNPSKPDRGENRQAHDVASWGDDVKVCTSTALTCQSPPADLGKALDVTRRSAISITYGRLFRHGEGRRSPAARESGLPPSPADEAGEDTRPHRYRYDFSPPSRPASPPQSGEVRADKDDDLREAPSCGVTVIALSAIGNCQVFAVLY
jgi:hypothetical protein